MRGLFNGEVAYTAPFYVSVNVTSRCNLKCVGCPFHSQYAGPASKRYSDTGDLSLDIFKRLCGELGALNTNSVVLRGDGEPFLHPDVFQMIAAAKESGLKVMLLTNGAMLQKEKVQALIDTKLDELRVTFWASSEEEYKKNYPGSNPDNFIKVIDGSKFLARLKS